MSPNVVKFWQSTPEHFKIGDLIICDWVDSLGINENCPSLEFDKGYTVEGIWVDKLGYQHLDVGLKQENVNYVRSYYTEEMIPSPNNEHWCHPTRFHHAKIKTMHFKHKTLGHVLSKKHFDNLSLKQQTHFNTTTEKPTHRYDDTITPAVKDDDDDSLSFFTTALVAYEISEMVAGDTSTPSVDSTPDFGGFGGGSGGGGGAGGDF